MRTLKASYFVRADPEALYEFVTVFPVDGEPDVDALVEKYGELLAREGNTFTFLENIGGGTKWECVFDPPRQRVMRAIDSTWSDRTDQFEPKDDGTQWTITWELKARKRFLLTQWLTFHLRAKRQIYSQMVLPAINHFEGAAPRQPGI